MKKLLIILFLLASPVFASAAVIDAFNSDTKTTGDLNGQDGWSGSTACDVTTGNPPAQEGDQGVACTNANGTIQLTITGQTASRISVYGQVTTTNADAYPLNLIESTVAKCQVYFNTSNNIVFANDLSGPTDTLVTGYNANQWYLFEVEVQTSDDTCRARIDNGTWTAWRTTTAFNSIDVVRFNDGAATVVYLDDLWIDRPAASTPPPPQTPFLFFWFGKLLNTAHAAITLEETALVDKITNRQPVSIEDANKFIKILNRELARKPQIMQRGKSFLSQIIGWLLKP